MKMQPEDWSREDVEFAFGALFGLKFERLREFDFPVHDYVDESGAQYWLDLTVHRWCDQFFTAHHTVMRAQDPAAFEQFVNEMVGQGGHAQ